MPGGLGEAVEHGLYLVGADVGVEGFGSRFQPYAFGRQAGDRGVETEGVHEGRDRR